MTYFRQTIEEMAGYTPGFQPKNADVVKLNTNENPWPCSPKVIEAIGKLNAENLRKYPEAAGDSFRTAAASVLDVQPDNIICTNGGDDLLTIALRAFCDADRPVAFAQPTYSLYPVLANLQGCNCIEVERDGGGSLDKLAEINAPLTIVCNPNAPTCEMLPIDAIETLAKELFGVLLIDEAYVDFADDNAIRLIYDYDNVLILRSMSKGYSLAGLRFGFGVAQSSIIEGLMKVKDSYNVDAVSIAAATAAMSDQAYLKSNVEKIKAERSRLTDQLNTMGFVVPQSQTNFILATSVQKDAKDIYDELIRRNIFLRYFALPNLEDKLRITIGTPDQNDELIAALKDILD